jgi:hypothetical protein
MFLVVVIASCDSVFFLGQWMFFVTMDASWDNGCFFLGTLAVSGSIGQQPTPTLTPTSTIWMFSKAMDVSFDNGCFLEKWIFLGNVSLDN